MIVVLAALLAFGTNEVPGAVVYTWEVLYRDDTAWFDTATPRLEFSPRRGVPFRLRVRADGGPWSDPSYEIVSDPLEGDTDFDCVVGTRDVRDVARAWGSSCLTLPTAP